MTKREIYLDYIKTFLFMFFTCFLGAIFGNFIYDEVMDFDKEPSIIQVTITYQEAKIQEDKKEDLVQQKYYEQIIDEDFDILNPSKLTKDELSYCVNDPERYKMMQYIDYIIQSEKKYGVNSLYLLCQLGLESGWGKYTSGKNNIGGWTTNDGSYKDFESVEDCIMHISRNISTYYKDSVGTKLKNVCSLYSTNKNYCNMLIDIMNDRQNLIKTMNKEGI